MNDPEAIFPTNISLEPDDTCPCQSGRPVRHCCMQRDGTVRNLFKGVLSDGPSTGFSHPDCYLGFLGDCTRKISAEHYFSQKVMRAINSPGEKAMRMAGLPWIPPGELRHIGIESLKSKILCRRHNTMLSPLDDSAGTVAKLFAKVFTPEAEGSDAFHLTSGAAFEAWAVKVALGGYHSDTWVGPKGVINGTKLNREVIVAALGGRPLPYGCGLYIRSGLDDTTNGWPQLQVTPLTMQWRGEDYFCGIDIALFDVAFRLVMEPEASALGDAAAGWKYRPNLVCFRRSDFTSILKFDWTDEINQGANVLIDLRQVPFDYKGFSNEAFLRRAAERG